MLSDVLAGVDAATAVGVVAALCSTASLAPQAWRIVRTRDVSGISAPTYVLTVAGFAAWLAYGALLGQWPLIVTNAICLALSGFILALTLMSPRRRDAVADAVDPAA